MTIKRPHPKKRTMKANNRLFFVTRERTFHAFQTFAFVYTNFVTVLQTSLTLPLAQRRRLYTRIKREC